MIPPRCLPSPPPPPLSPIVYASLIVLCSDAPVSYVPWFAGVSFSSVNVLDYPPIREGVKAFT